MIVMAAQRLLACCLNPPERLKSPEPAPACVCLSRLGSPLVAPGHSRAGAEPGSVQRESSPWSSASSVPLPSHLHADGQDLLRSQASTFLAWALVLSLPHCSGLGCVQQPCEALCCPGVGVGK